MSVPRRPPALFAAPLLVLALLLTGCSSDGAPAKTPVGAPGPQSDAASVRRASPSPDPTPSPAGIPGLGPETLAQVPAEARQVFVVTGEEADSNQSGAVLYSREDPAESWQPVLGP